MSIDEKIKNAKTTEWLSEGISQVEIEKIKKLALISSKIQLKRNSLGMNQKQFAKMMNVTQGMISKWESGEYNFTLTTLIDICSKLDLEFEPNIKDNEYCYENAFETISISFENNIIPLDEWCPSMRTEKTKGIA
ncbi:MAG: helix-turn-helix transcriptional regulator [Clostridiales bacterium]|nr:helix-turn-helix transcriptional regulator [Clostridiales bacterium]